MRWPPRQIGGQQPGNLKVRNMFESVAAAAPDAILGLNEAFQNDPRERKVNLTVGVYHDAQGQTPILSCVKEAERRLIETEHSKSYLRIEGRTDFDQRVPELLLGPTHHALTAGRTCTAQTPGGTSALRIAADWLGEAFPNARFWLSTPTWPNHPNVLRAAGRQLQSYRYYNVDQHAVEFDQMMYDLAGVTAGDVVVLHGCCHNPTGADLDEDQWEAVARCLQERQALPLIDFAYQGLARGLEPDAAALRTVCATVDELIVCSSYSKNFGLYRERVGALTILTRTSAAADAVLSRVKKCIRSNYSNPPSHGASIVATVLGDPQLRAGWMDELATMRERICSMRSALAAAIQAENPSLDYSFLTRQHGMFSLTGLTPDHVAHLREEYSIYVVANGRINLAGLNQHNLEYVAGALAAALG